MGMGWLRAAERGREVPSGWCPYKSWVYLDFQFSTPLEPYTPENWKTGELIQIIDLHLPQFSAFRTF